MNQKKSRKKSKKSSKSVSNKKLVKIFLLLFLIAFLVSLVVYFKLKEKNTIKNIPDNSTISSSEIKPETLFPKVLDKDPSSNQLFEEKFNLNEENKFEEYTNELEKVIEDKLEREDFINKENEIIQKKVEEIKEEKAKELNAKKETKEQNKNKEKEKTDEKSIITNKDSFTYDKKSKPKIAIVIDDVSSQAQKDAILAMGYKITMAFFPPTSGHPDSARIAQNLPFYMIHFPMQASPKFKSPETHTLNITDSYETIENRVKQLRAWYPNAVYTNNHTGSVFTENDEAMDKLFKALVKYNFIFVDSKTSAKSVGQKYANKYNLPYISRNIFLDNEKSYEYIKAQLIKTVELAKKHGYAVAIGHPYDITLKVLKESKHLLNDVDPILVNKLPHL